MAYTAGWIQMFFVFTAVFAAASGTRIRAGRANRDGWTLFYPRSNTRARDCNRRIGVCGPRTLDGHAKSVDAKIGSTYFGELPPSDLARFFGARPFEISPDVAII